MARDNTVVGRNRFGPQEPQATVPENKNAVNGRPSFYECGICGHMHPASWDGDCRDDNNRFTIMELEETFGDIIEEWDANKPLKTGWNEVPMPGSEENIEG